MEEVEANLLSSLACWDLIRVRQAKGRGEKGEIQHLGSSSYDAASLKCCEKNIFREEEWVGSRMCTQPPWGGDLLLPECFTW